MDYEKHCLVDLGAPPRLENRLKTGWFLLFGVEFGALRHETEAYLRLIDGFLLQQPQQSFLERLGPKDLKMTMLLGGDSHDFAFVSG